MPSRICCCTIGYCADVSERAATAATAAAPPRTNEEIRIETPCFYLTGTEPIGMCVTHALMHRPRPLREAMVRTQMAYTNVNANHSQYWASLSLIARGNKYERTQSLMAAGS